jgi:hypothetical protein
MTDVCILYVEQAGETRADVACVAKSSQESRVSSWNDAIYSTVLRHEVEKVRRKAHENNRSVILNGPRGRSKSRGA